MRMITLAMFAVASITLGDVALAQDEAQVEQGREVFQYWCATCHGEGRGFGGTSALTVKYKDTEIPGLLEARTDLSAPLVRAFVRNGVSIMPFFRKTEVSDADLDAIAAYLTRPPSMRTPASQAR